MGRYLYINNRHSKYLRVVSIVCADCKIAIQSKWLILTGEYNKFILWIALKPYSSLYLPVIYYVLYGLE